MQVFLFGSWFLISLAHSAEADCGTLTNPVGPYDYRDRQYWKNGLPPQGTNHFVPEVENLIRGYTGTILGDLDYTLRHFPNHQRALWAVSRYERKLGGKLPDSRGMTGGWRRTAECYFDRAVRFMPDDSKVWMVWGMHLHATGKPPDALAKYQRAKELGESSADFYYNRGLLMFDLGRFSEALNDAHAAYSKGFALPGLRAKLQKAGKWKASVDSQMINDERAGASSADAPRPKAPSDENPGAAPAPSSVGSSALDSPTPSGGGQ